MLTLTPVASQLSGVHPTLDADGNITALVIDIALSLSDGVDVSIGQTVSFDAWPLLTSEQQANMNEIQAVIMGHIVSTYFA